MKFTFLGGADEVGASGILVEISGRRLLVDCGIRPSPKARDGLAGDQLPDLSLLERAGGVDAVLATHAHTDHTGALELILERLPGAPVYATAPTVALVRVLHQDARRIMQTRLEEEGELPLFDEVAVERLMAAFEAVPFHERVSLGEGLAATFYPAGHIAGAAMIGLESDEGRVLISGDLSLSPQRTVSAAKLPPFEPDVLVLESTYGGRLHANRAVQERRMVEVVGEVTQAGGKVLIPAFALGRAQEVLLILREFQRRGELPAVPVWADGMVRSVCQVYTAFQETLPLPLQEQGADFFTGAVRAVQSSEQRNALLWQADPAVIVSSSGMLAGGPSTAYARALAGQPQHAILLTGYQDEESPGRRLQEMAEKGRGALWLGKDKVDVQCRLGSYSLSAHADEGQLISLVETLNPEHVVLVHGDETARGSLARALEERKRITHLPKAGQTLTFSFETARAAIARSSAKLGPLDATALWREVAGTAGGYFSLKELARAWWGDAFEQPQLDELAAALALDDLYFAVDPRREGVYRARHPAQVEAAQLRRERMPALGHLPGQWLSLRRAGSSAVLVRCVSLGRDHFLVETDEGEWEQAWPEDLLEVYGAERPDESVLPAPISSPGAAGMEPNQALALARQKLPPESRLRKAGYRLDQHTLVLTFDFPTAAVERYASEIAALETETGWKVEIPPEANQNALFALAAEVLPPGWKVIKGPALHRQERRVALTAVPAPGRAAPGVEQARRRFREESGFDLDLAVTAAPHPAPLHAQPLPGTPGAPWEINAAYASIRAGLEGSSLYRTSLKDGEILLSFISPQVGERYREQIEQLEKQVGWRLRIHPQSNQGAVVEALQAIFTREGVRILKGPGIYLERSEVAVTAANLPEEDRQGEIAVEFLERTGFKLLITPGAMQGQENEPARPTTGAGRGHAYPPGGGHAVDMIPVALIRLRRFQRDLVLDPLKVEKAAERARRLGQISPPIRVTRLEDGYLLADGLYRLRAAEQLGMEKIPAIIE
jgi:Cft2 family RNA processing exonuclease